MRRPTRPSTSAVLTALTTVGAVLASTVALAAPAAAAAGTGTVIGTVRTGDVGLAGVVVTARTPAERVLATTTGDDGSYTLTGVPSGLRSICFDGATAQTTAAPLGYSRGCYPNSTSAALATPVDVPADVTVRGIDGRLSPLAALDGVVTDTTGAPVPGVVVRPWAGSASSATSGADGRYRLPFGVGAPTTVRPCFDATGVVTASAPAGLLAVCRTDPVPLDTGQTVTVDQVLTPAGAVAGRVTDPDGAVLAGVTVVVSRPASERNGVVVPGVTVGTAVTTADGRYRVPGLPPRADLVVGFDGRSVPAGAAPFGYVGQCWGDQVTEDVTSCVKYPGRLLRLTPGGTRTGVNGRLLLAGAMYGVVLDADGRGVPGMPVSAQPDGGSPAGSTVSGPDGTWEVRGLRPADTYRVCAFPPSTPAPVPQPNPDGYEYGCHREPSGATTVTVVGGQRTGPVDVVVPGHGAISGRVVDGTGRPVSGMQVAYSGPGEAPVHGVIRSGVDGRFRIGGLRVADYRFCLTPDSATSQPGLGFPPRCEPDVAVTDDVTTDLGDLVFVEGGVVAGRITDFAGYPVYYASVRAINLATGYAGGWSAPPIMPSSTYTTGPLPPGRYSVCVRGGARADGSAPPGGFAPQCWKQKVEGATPTPVRVASGATVTGVDFRLRPVAG